MDKSLFTSFYRKHVDKIYRFLYYRVGGNKEFARDLTQDVFMKAFQAFDRYDERISGSAWIFTIARNHLLNQLAKDRGNVSLEAIEETSWDRLDWAAKAEIRYDEKRLLEAMKCLRQDDADLVRKKYLEGWSFEELAQQDGKTSGALRIKAHRALKCLRKELKKR